jgi:hypothetical protein
MSILPSDQQCSGIVMTLSVYYNQSPTHMVEAAALEQTSGLEGLILEVSIMIPIAAVWSSRANSFFSTDLREPSLLRQADLLSLAR